MDDEPETLQPPYKIEIRRVSDGVVRVYDMKEGQWSRFWFEDGNGACDCSRSDFFNEAGGEPIVDDPPCGNDAYVILRYIFPDGTILPGDDHP